jgi:hypothetical protein
MAADSRRPLSLCENVAASGAAVVAATLVTHPIDVVKVRLQVATGLKLNTVRCSDCSVSGVRSISTLVRVPYQLPDTRYQLPGVEYLVPDTWYLVPGTWYQVFGTRPGMRYLVPDHMFSKSEHLFGVSEHWFGEHWFGEHCSGSALGGKQRRQC